VVAAWGRRAERSEMRLLLRSSLTMSEKMCSLMSGNSDSWQPDLLNYRPCHFDSFIILLSNSISTNCHIQITSKHP
jgi:hypothetical protein